MGRRRGGLPPAHCRAPGGSGTHRGAVSAGQAAHGAARTIRAAAEEQLALALAVPGGEAHVPSLLLLAAIYRERKDWLKARQLLGRAAAAVTDVGDKTRILGEAAEICATALDDEVQAAELYTEILALDSTRTDLVEKLAEIKLRRGDFSGLLPLAELLVARRRGGIAAERARRQHRLGRAREATGDEAGSAGSLPRRGARGELLATPSAATLAARRDLRRSHVQAPGLDRGRRRLPERAGRSRRG